MKKIFIKYLKALNWIFLSLISILPTNIIRKTLLRLLGLKIGDAVLYSRFHIRQPDKISIGDGTVIGHAVTLDGRLGITIGNNVNISSEVMIWTMQHDYKDPLFDVSGGKVVIENYVWLSTRSIILPNIKIGEGAVVSAGSVVTKDVEPFTIVGGNPAKVIGKRNPNLKYSPKKIGVIPII